MISKPRRKRRGRKQSNVSLIFFLDKAAVPVKSVGLVNLDTILCDNLCETTVYGQYSSTSSVVVNKYPIHDFYIDWLLCKQAVDLTQMISF